MPNKFEEDYTTEYFVTVKNFMITVNKVHLLLKRNFIYTVYTILNHIYSKYTGLSEV